MQNRQTRRKHLLWTTVLGLTTLFGIDTHWAAEDRRPDETCAPFSHLDPCEHKYPTNPGMCKSPLALCVGATSQAICLNTEISYFAVKNDFPQGQTDNPTMTCQQIEGGSGSYTIWTAHTYIYSPSRECYKQVRCRWEPAPANTCVYDHDVTGWSYLPKKTMGNCL